MTRVFWCLVVGVVGLLFLVAREKGKENKSWKGIFRWLCVVAYVPFFFYCLLFR